MGNPPPVPSGGNPPKVPLQSPQDPRISKEDRPPRLTHQTLQERPSVRVHLCYSPATNNQAFADNMVQDFYPLYLDEGELTFDLDGKI